MRLLRLYRATERYQPRTVGERGGMSENLVLGLAAAEPAHVLLERFAGDPPARADPDRLELATPQEFEDLGSPYGQSGRRLLRSQKEWASQRCRAALQSVVGRGAHVCSLQGGKERPSLPIGGNSRRRIEQ